MLHPIRPLLLHDYLLQAGGAERVVDALMLAYPHAELVTSLASRRFLSRYADRRVHTSSLQRLPVGERTFRCLLPLYAHAFETVPLPDADIAVCSSSGWSHLAAHRLQMPVLVYCHTPARWLWRGGEYFEGTRLATVRPVLEPLLGRLRAKDVDRARAATRYVANSASTADRIARCYGIDADVVHPPVGVERFRHDLPRDDFYLVVSRLLDYKRIDVAIDACSRLSRRLVVVGDGPALERLRARSGPTVRFAGWRPDDQVRDLMQTCRALIVPGSEDFGIAAVEAMAAGAPVVALDAGGVAETVRDGHTGVLFGRCQPAAAASALLRLEAADWPAARMAAEARRFASDRFVEEMRMLIDDTLGRPLRTAIATPA